MLHYLPFNEYLQVLIDKKITASQGLFLHLLLTGDHANIYRYVNENQQFTREELTELEDYGYIFYQGPRNPHEQFYSDYYVVTEMFTDGLNLLDPTVADQFWDAYPGFATIVDGQFTRRIPMKSFDEDIIKRDYLQKIRYDLKLHEQVMDILDWAKQNDLIQMGIRKFVDSRQWNMLRELREARSSQILGPGYGEHVVE